MTTASQLAEVTDRGKFERIAIQILRKFESECAAILRLGTNTLDEPIPSALDGFCRVPGVHPPRFVSVECTTTDPGGLRKKWLKGWYHSPGKVKTCTKSNDTGDLVKAASEASQLRTQFPDASFKVHLAVNQCVKQELYVEVQKASDELGVECEIWDVTRLADFLDRPEGQVFRRELGISAPDLSPELLAEIGLASLERCQQEALTDPNLWINREAGAQLRSRLSIGGHSLIALVGDPGRGKTSLGFQALVAHLRSGGFGLCVDAERIGDCHNLDEAIGETIRSHSPNLALGQERAFRQFLEPGRTFVVLLEDLNRAASPTRLLQKIIALTRPQGGKSLNEISRTPTKPGASVVVLMPTWPAHMEEVATRLKESPWITMLNVNHMDPREADEALARVFDAARSSVGPALRVEIAVRLERDPILIGLLGRLLISNVQSDPAELSADVAGHYLERCIEETTARTNCLLKSDVSLALDRLAAQLLLSRCLNPPWSTVRGWFLDDQQSMVAITSLAMHGGIVRINRIDGTDCLGFRHDRLMQELLSRTLTESIKSGNWPDSLFDPFFAETTGKALLGASAGTELLRKVADRCPLALFEAVRNQRSADKSATQAIADESLAWCSRLETSGQIVPSVLNHIAWSLMTTDSVNVIEFVRRLPPHPLLLLAGLRNGSAECGVSYLAGDRGFQATVWDHQLKRALEMTLVRHADRIIFELKSILRDPVLSDDRRKGAIELAGYLASTELETDIVVCRERAQDAGIVFIPGLWAALRCLGEDPLLLVIPTIKEWQNLSDEYDENGKKSSQRDIVANSLRMASVHGLSDRTVRFLISEDCPSDTKFARNLFHVFEQIDHPDALEFRIRYAAKTIESYQVGYFSSIEHDLTRPWKSSSGSSFRRLSEAPLARARNLWEDAANTVQIRQAAFQLWLTQLKKDDLPALRQIPSTSLLFEQTIPVRAELGDHSCVPLLIDKIREATWNFQLAPPVWCVDLYDLADECLEALENQIPNGFKGGFSNDAYTLSELLVQIPCDQADRLLSKHWAHLRYSPRFIQASLYVGTPGCLARADASIRECPPEIDVMKHFSFLWGINTSGRQDSLTLNHLERLLPYIERLDDLSIRAMADFCNRRGYHNWVRNYLQRYLSEAYRADLCPTESDIEGELNKFASEEIRSSFISYWATEGGGHFFPSTQLITILRRWLVLNTSAKAYLVASIVIASVGVRTDLEVLEGWPAADLENGRRVIEDTRNRIERRSLR